MTIAELTLGKKLNLEALYWDRPIEAAAELVGLALKAGQAEVTFRVSGTPDEQLLKWVTAEDDRVVRGHLCPAGCTNSPQSEDLIHVKKLRLLEFDTPAWAHNLKEAAESEVLRKLAAESDRRAREAKGKGVGAPAAKIAKGTVSTDSSREKKKKRNKKKEKKKKTQVVESRRQEGAEATLPVHRVRSRGQHPQGRDEEGPKSYGRVGRQFREQQRRDPINEPGGRAVRGLPPHQASCDERARCTIMPDDTEHVQVFVDLTRPSGCSLRRCSTGYMSTVPSPGASRAIVSSAGKGEPEHLLSGRCHASRSSCTMPGHPVAEAEISGGLGRRSDLGGCPKAGVDPGGILTTGGSRRKSLSQSRVERRIKKQTSLPEDMARSQGRGEEQQQEQERRTQRKRKEGQRWERQERTRTGEGQVNSPLEGFSAQAIEAELNRLEMEVNDGEKFKVATMPNSYLGEMQYEHPDATILVGTEHEGRAGPDCTHPTSHRAR